MVIEYVSPTLSYEENLMRFDIIKDHVISICDSVEEEYDWYYESLSSQIVAHNLITRDAYRISETDSQPTYTLLQCADLYINNLAQWYANLGFTSASILYLRRALKIKERLFVDCDNIEYIFLYLHLADQYTDLQSFKEAELWISKAEKIALKRHGKYRKMIVDIYISKAKLFITQGQNKKARLEINNAFKYVENYDRKNNELLVSLYTIKGNSYTQPPLRIQCYEKALELSKKGNDIEKALILNNLGAAYDDANDWTHSIGCYNRSIEIVADYPQEKRLLASLYDNLSIALKIKGEYEEALNQSLKAAKIFEDIVGQTHPDTQICYSNIITNATQLNRDDIISVYSALTKTEF
jgi:tetratricopeptide (TPR) repeat protein